MKREGEGLETLEQFITDWGAPDCIRRDNSKMQNSDGWKKMERKMKIKSETSEPHNQQQNPAECRIQTIKRGTQEIMDRTGSPKFMWFECLTYYTAIMNMISLDRLGGKNAYEVAFGHSVDISAYLEFEFWEPIYYLDSDDPSFPNSKEKQGRFCGIAENCGDLMTFKIYVQKSHSIIHRSVVRSAKNDINKPNLRALNPNYDGMHDDEDSLFSMNIDDAADTDRIEIARGDEAKVSSDIPIDIIDDEEMPILISRSDMEPNDPKLMNGTTSDSIPDPKDLIGFTFPFTDDDGTTLRAEVKSKEKDTLLIFIIQILSN